VVIMQRLHEDDLTGHLERRGGYEILRLPSEFEPERVSATCGGLWRDPRRLEGELLFPERFPRAVLADVRRSLGSHGYAEQHQQSPSPRGGGLFKTVWWRRFRQVPKNATRFVGSVDCAFKATASSDFVVAQVWACLGANRYLVWQCRRRLTFTETKALVARMAARWKLEAVLVEDKANGSAVLDALRDSVPGILPVNPGAAGKEARAAAVTPAIEAGQVWIPEDPSGNVQAWTDGAWVESGGWEADEGEGEPVETFLTEMGGFPKSRHDDQVDALSQALRWLREAPSSSAPLNAVASPLRPTGRLDI
jgi:phage terminase large subunit-like protein